MVGSWILIACGALNIVSNLALMFLTDKVTHVMFFDNEGRLVNYNFDQVGLLVLAFCKVVGGTMVIY